ncbi:MAG: hypothetical protein NTY38_10495, partial [Acidobacteria bacterium]|nr:hypothetical protein [Acidobacteriota bacterium]
MTHPADLRLLLAPISGAIAGAASLWAFGKLTNQEELRRRRNRIQARVMELRLYRDEPRVILRALGAIVSGNLRLLGTVSKPLVVLVVPLALITIHLDGLLGRQALPLGAPALLTVRLAGAEPSVRLTTPPSIRVETPPVHIEAEHELVWRLRPMSPMDGALRIEAGGVTLEKSVIARDQFAYLAPRRDRDLFAFLTSPFESR